LTPRFLDHITRRRKELTIAAILVATLYFAARATGVLNTLPSSWRMFAWSLLSSYFGLTWILALVGLARHHIRSGGPNLRYATQTVYPFYIFHQTILIAAGYYVIQ
jgi:hypothetical protein